MSVSRLPRGSRLGIVTAIAASLTLSACSGTPAPAPDEQPDYSVLTLASSTEPTSWDPALQLSAFDGVWRWAAVFDTLLTCEEDGSVSPGAAEAFEFSDDHTVLTLDVRDGMTFEDGTAIDAAAVVGSLSHIQNGGGSAAIRLAGLVFEAPDASTVVITSPAPRGLLPAYMCLSTGIVASPASLASDTLDTQPVSSGAYALDADRSTAGSTYTFTKRDDYWNAEAYPYQELVLQIMPDATARLNALKTGQVDGAVISTETVAEAEASQLAVSELVDATNGILIFDRDGTKVPALGDERVRQAINMVFDREGIATGLFQGRQQPTEQLFGPDTAAYDADLSGIYEYDVEAAKDLMADAGYADGFSIEIPSRTPQTDQANPLIVQQLALLNITVTEVPLAGPTAVPEILSGRFPLTYISMPTSTGLWDVEQSISPTATWNVLDSADDELTALTVQAQTAQGDDLADILQQINAYVVEQAWFAPWTYRVAYFATAGDVEILSTGDAYTKVPRLQDFR
jgi:peptide/nickel transport system substrate-binding protein